MEEEDHDHGHHHQEQEQEVMKHVCKFCNKSFPSGRSLGGHMRSHVTNNNNCEAEEKEKLSSSEATGTNTNNSSGYGLRENPKKTWRIIADSSNNSEDNNNNNNSSSFSSLLLCDKLCKECGKGFTSWKALFGHMKRHSHHSSSASATASDQDSYWTTKKLPVMDSQSDNEVTTAAAAAPPRRRTRSKRKTTRRYNNNNATAKTSSCSVHSEAEVEIEIEQEQEEVALSLMMLSRDVGNWWGTGAVLHSLAESSEVGRVGTSAELLDFVAEEKENVGFSIKKESALDFDLDLEDAGFEHGKSQSKKYSSIKKISNSNSSSAKRGKFECTTCQRIFHSYQALGGHRASHKKIKGSIQIEIEIETELSPNNKIQSVENEELGFDDDYDDEAEEEEDDDEEDSKTAKKVNKVHECPICLKVFSSGQALGGHKRSHTAKIDEQEQEQVLEIRVRDLLDLNLPAEAAATTEMEESNNSFNADSNNRYWWEEAPLVGLIS